VGDIGSGKCVVWGREHMEAIFSAGLFCEPETALKNNLLKNISKIHSKATHMLIKSLHFPYSGLQTQHNGVLV
jgi:hypothetical protein